MLGILEEADGLASREWIWMGESRKWGCECALSSFSYLSPPHALAVVHQILSVLPA